ncbi:type II toxin-antitoxin system mRNA interferase toxin, RelE/StbE family [Candidatus Kaiserbacteria bacterium]|nr:type II toxin-antitoxin system mRNA interferase toxin, RelE/StbE family [Candidatus Kaiserbacteria bacterium]
MIPERRIDTTPHFDHALTHFLKAHPDLREKTLVLIDRLAIDPFDPRNKTHRLSGPLKSLWGAHISFQYRLIFAISDDAILLINTGSHDEVY